MFKFNFEPEVDTGEDSLAALLESQHLDEYDAATAGEDESLSNDVSLTSQAIDISELIAKLPDAVSYSFVSIPDLSSTGSVALRIPRRELFDIRLQLQSSDSDQQREESKFADDPSDLVDGQYEGGLKTWECSIDLAAYLHHKPQLDYQDVLELGCGSALPTLTLLHQLFSSSPTASRERRVFHFQDFNASVLQLVTLPNIILTWCMQTLQTFLPVISALTLPSIDFSPAASELRAKHSIGDGDGEEELELELTQSLITAFLASLEAYKVSLQFTNGSWSSFLKSATKQKFHLVLTSETIYRISSVASLLSVMKDVSRYSQQDDDHETVVFVAAKVLYFGVGGGISNFLELLKENNGRADQIWSWKGKGVGRHILQIRWS